MNKMLIIVAVVVAAYFLVFNAHQKSTVNTAAGEVFSTGKDFITGGVGAVQASNLSGEVICGGKYCVTVTNKEG